MSAVMLTVEKVKAPLIKSGIPEAAAEAVAAGVVDAIETLAASKADVREIVKDELRGIRDDNLAFQKAMREDAQTFRKEMLDALAVFREENQTFRKEMREDAQTFRKEMLDALAVFREENQTFRKEMREDAKEMRVDIKSLRLSIWSAAMFATVLVSLVFAALKIMH